MSTSKVRRVIVSAVLGLWAAVALHYFLYRFGLPVTPFIYQVF